jgi:lipid-A-disaccharide synthase-like uncharacterized protein
LNWAIELTLNNGLGYLIFGLRFNILRMWVSFKKIANKVVRPYPWKISIYNCFINMNYGSLTPYPNLCDAQN